MKRRKVLSLLVGLALIVPAFTVFAEESPVPQDTSSPSLLITEVLNNGAATNEEFIEVFNAGLEPVDLSNVKLERATAASTSELNWGAVSVSPALTGQLAPGEYLLVAHESYTSLSANYRFKTNLSNSGGHLRAVWDNPATSSVEKIELDKLGWGSAAMPEGVAPAAPAAGSSLQRCVLETMEYGDTNDNSVDFKEFNEPTPGTASIECYPPAAETEPTLEPPVTEEEQPESPAEVEETPAIEQPETEQISLLPVQITELLPNPKSPATDADDEYVEIYNPNDTEVDLTGWRLETGSSFSYRVFLDGLKVPAQSYNVITSKDTSLTLSNTAGAARLLDKDGQVQSQSDNYSDADDGLAWSFIGGIWQWTSTPTPVGLNIFTPVAVNSVKAATKKTTAKKATAKKTATTAKKSTVKSKTDVAGRSIFEEPPTDGQMLPVNPAVLAVVGAAAVGYSLYEYRHDLRNRIERSRRHRAIRRAARAKA